MDKIELNISALKMFYLNNFINYKNQLIINNLQKNDLTFSSDSTQKMPFLNHLFHYICFPKF